jgi:nucleotide-binding universal stress UspA family protein
MSWMQEKKIVVPIDFSPESLAAIRVALEIAAEPEDVHTVHVLAPLSAIDPAVVWDVVTDESRIEKAMTTLRERLDEEGLADVTSEIEVGDPGHAIVDYADRIQANLIVLPSHGRTGVSRILLGSVAERVCRYAHCPVLVLRQKSD